MHILNFLVHHPLSNYQQPSNLLMSSFIKFSVQKASPPHSFPSYSPFPFIQRRTWLPTPNNRNRMSDPSFFSLVSALEVSTVQPPPSFIESAVLRFMYFSRRCDVSFLTSNRKFSIIVGDVGVGACIFRFFRVEGKVTRAHKLET